MDNIKQVNKRPPGTKQIPAKRSHAKLSKRPLEILNANQFLNFFTQMSAIWQTL